MSYSEINFPRVCFNNAESVFSPSFSRLVLIPLIRVPFLPTYRSSCFHMPRRKSICKENLWERSTSPTRAKCRYAARISFPGRGCLTSRNLRAQSTARPRYPFGILFNLSLSLYRICLATADEETKSILYPCCAHAHATDLYISRIRLQRFLSLEHTALPTGQNERKFILFHAAKSPFSVIFEKLFSFLSSSF